jgi:hypothetical protein
MTEMTVLIAVFGLQLPILRRQDFFLFLANQALKKSAVNGYHFFMVADPPGAAIHVFFLV